MIGLAAGVPHALLFEPPPADLSVILPSAAAIALVAAFPTVTLFIAACSIESARYARTACEASSGAGQSIGRSPGSRLCLATSVLMRLALIENASPPTRPATIVCKLGVAFVYLPLMLQLLRSAPGPGCVKTPARRTAAEDYS